MTFNKTEYWKNRSEGKRGQGEYVALAIKDDTLPGSHFMQIGSGLVRTNRAVSRHKLRDHRYTSKTARLKSKEETEATADRVARKEAGEKQRIASLKEQAAL